MKKKIIAAAIMGVLASPVSSASDEWTNTEVAMETAALLLITADWYTSRIAQGRGYEEANPLLGRNPGPAKLNLYFIGAAAGQLWLADALPHSYRKAFLALTIGGELYSVHNNLVLTVGVRAHFKP